MNNHAELDRSFLALSHPVRRAIVEHRSLWEAKFEAIERHLANDDEEEVPA